MRRLMIYAALALVVFSCTYGGNETSKSNDSTKVDGTETELPVGAIDSTTIRYDSGGAIMSDSL